MCVHFPYDFGKKFSSEKVFLCENCEDLVSVLGILWFFCPYRQNGFTGYKSYIKVTELEIYSIFFLEKKRKKKSQVLYIFIFTSVLVTADTNSSYS